MTHDGYHKAREEEQVKVFRLVLLYSGLWIVIPYCVFSILVFESFFFGVALFELCVAIFYGLLKKQPLLLIGGIALTANTLLIFRINIFDSLLMLVSCAIAISIGLLMFVMCKRLKFSLA